MSSDINTPRPFRRGVPPPRRSPPSGVVILTALGCALFFSYLVQGLAWPVARAFLVVSLGSLGLILLILLIVAVLLGQAERAEFWRSFWDTAHREGKALVQYILRRSE